MQLSFLGAAGTVTGSRYLLSTGGGRLLIDCGLFQGYKQLRLRNWAPLPFEPKELDAVVLTHAHIDHSGYLPLLSRLGFSGPIYCSRGTAELCKLLLRDAAHLQEEDAKFANRHGFSKHRPALPLFTKADAEACLRQFHPIDYDATFEPLPAVRATLSRAGHLLGASSVRLATDQTSILFSGDLGRAQDPLLKPPANPPKSDYLVIESTYGDRAHPLVDAEAELSEWLNRGCARAAVTVIPTFAVGRAQALLLHISRLKQRQAIPNVPVYLDSPMAVDATTLYYDFNHEHRLSHPECVAMCRAATIVNTPEQSKALDQRHGPMIILSASGMASGGRVLHHLKAFIGDPKNLVLFAGFQAPGTRGAALLTSAKTLRMHGADFPVRAEVGQLRAHSSHADADELLAWARKLESPPKRVFVTHGEPSASEALRYRFEHELGWRASVPDYRDKVELE
jgi:metallo-beta-lactamase family protein